MVTHTKKLFILTTLALFICSSNAQTISTLVNPLSNGQETNSSNDYQQRRKKILYILGCFSGFSCPFSYALAVGFNLVDADHPLIQETIQPFARGACAGIGLWFAYKIFEWYIQVAALKMINKALQIPIIEKIVVENFGGHTTSNQSN